jgi:HAD superfamily hydrolase (TIGR01509 family)
MIRALIFDFDGVILETESPIFQSWQELYRSHGCDLTLEAWSEIIGTAESSFDPIEALEHELNCHLDREELEDLRLQRETELIADQVVLPGVREYLEDARRLSLMLGLASSSPCNWVTGHLARLGLLEYFDIIKARDDVPRTKPDPALYQAVLASLDLHPNQAIVFEDSPNGILAAKRAGLLCIAVPNQLTAQLPLEKADMRLESLADIPLEELLKQIGKKFV